jgi:uncharacterized membrane protein YkvA (DUF1232 family)
MTRRGRLPIRLRQLVTRGFQAARGKARDYLRNPGKLRGLLEGASKKSDGAPRGVFGTAWRYLLAMIRLIRAYAKGTYREVDVETLLTVVAVVLYFVNPFDIIPDWLPGIGYLDDAAVLGMALKQVRGALEKFLTWETAGERTDGAVS